MLIQPFPRSPLRLHPLRAMTIRLPRHTRHKSLPSRLTEFTKTVLAQQLPLPRVLPQIPGLRELGSRKMGKSSLPFLQFEFVFANGLCPAMVVLWCVGAAGSIYDTNVNSGGATWCDSRWCQLRRVDEVNLLSLPPTPQIREEESLFHLHIHIIRDNTNPWLSANVPIFRRSFVYAWDIRQDRDQNFATGYPELGPLKVDRA